jgi:putative membrane protein
LIYKVMLPLGYLVMLGVWGVLLGNFWSPLPGNLALLMKLIMGLVVMMHLIQLAVFKGVLGQQLKLGMVGVFDILLFGVFALWRRWQKLAAAQTVTPSL